MCKTNVLSWVAVALVIIGGLNWGLIGFFEFDLVSSIFGVMSTISRIIYGLIGLSALYTVFLCFKCCKKGSCSVEGS